MHSTDADLAWSAITTVDPSRFDRTELASLLSSIERVRRVCNAVEVQAVRRSRALAETGAGEPPENLMAASTGSSSRTARAAAAREHACAAMPAIETALNDGTLSAGHVDAAATAHGRLDAHVAAAFADHAPDLARRATDVPVDMFERECRELARHLQRQADTDADVTELQRQRSASSVKRWVNRSTGMHNTLLSLDPLRDSQVWKVLNAEVGRQRRQRRHDSTPTSFDGLQADSLVAIVCAPPTASSTTRVPEVSLLIDHDTLQGDAAHHGMVCETDDGSPLPVSTVRRLCCDAHVIPIVLNSDGAVLDQGRRVRTATPEQRTAIAAMHRACAFPDCTVSVVDCRIHHIRWWWKHHGRSDLGNLIPLCERHHHLVHEGGWGLTMTADRIATFTRPDDTVLTESSTLDRRPRDIPMLR